MLWLRVHFVPLGIFFPVAFGMNRIGQHYHYVNINHKEEEELERALHSGSRVDGNFFWRVVSLNSNYHLEHHLFPAIPFYKLHHVNRLLRPVYEEYNIRNFGYGQLLYLWFLKNMEPHQDWRTVASKHFDTQSSDDNESLLKVLLEMLRLATAMPVVLSIICGVGRAIGYAKNKIR